MNRFVAFSGGIDSTSLAILEEDATPVFTDTRWEFHAIYEHIEKFESITGRKVLRIQAKDGLPAYIRSYRFFPNHGARFCTPEFKIKPLNVYLKNHLPCELLIGLRADEPMRVGNQTELEGLNIRYPLRERGLSRVDCVKICIERDLLPRYPPYMARGGCIGCFYKRKSEIIAMATLVPETLNELSKLEQDVQDERGKFFYMFPNLGMSIDDFLKQPFLFDQDEMYRDASDSSDKGVACGLFCHR